MPYPATPRTWVAGDVLTAAQLNAEIRDALLGAFPLGPPDGAWTPYTPTLTQSVAVTKTATYAKYSRVGRTITVALVLDVTGTGTAGNDILIGLPVAAAAINVDCGYGIVYDASAGLGYGGILEVRTTTTVCLRSMTQAGGFLGTINFTAALAASDAIRVSLTYESAT